MFARLIVLLLAFIAIGDASAQTPPSKPAPTKVMIVGTFHLDNPGRDVFNVQVDDVLAKKRQAELADIANALAKFAPTQVMVEWPEATTDAQYASYRAGKLEPSRNEVVQLGFRLAKLRDLERVHGIDVQGEFPFDAVKEYASSHGMQPRLDAALAGAGKEVQNLSERVASGTIGSVLRYMNQSSRLLENHGFYMDMLRYGEGGTQPGARLVSAWYARNLSICARLLQTVPEGGRAVVFFGEGHAYLLRQCVIEAPGVELVEANDFLPK
jgi:hypothetical protein